MNTASGGWIALLAGLVLASPGPAMTLTFRNELRVAVIVQTVTSVGGMTRRDKPALLPPGKMVTFDLDGDKIFTVYDARSNRVLFRSALKDTGRPVSMGIVLDPR